METWEIIIKLGQIEADLFDVYIKIRVAESLTRGPTALLTEHDRLLDRLKVLRGVMNG